MPVVALELAGRAEAVPRARRFVAHELDAPHRGLLPDVQLVVTELVTNAVLHGEAPLHVRVELRGDSVRLEVEDAGRTLPVRPQVRVDAMTGRGLALVAALSSTWGIDPAPGGGKVVWAELSPAGPAAGGVQDGAGADIDAMLAAWHEDGDEEGRADRPAEYTVRLGAVPTELLLAAKSHIDNIVREFTLAAGSADGPGPRREPSRLIRAVTQGFASARAEIKRQALEAAQRGDVETELVLTQPASAANAGEEYLAALEEADQYARAARLLTLETPLVHRVFRRWYVQALVDQIRAQATGVQPPPARTLLQVLSEHVAGWHDERPDVPFGAVFAQMPTPHVLLDTDLVVVAVNDAHLALSGRRREDVVGRPVFEVFPPAPDALDEHGRNPTEVSYLRARDTGRPHQLPLARYSVADPETGETSVRHYSSVSAPVLGPDGSVGYVLQRVEDVTDYVRARQSPQGDDPEGQQRTRGVEADLYNADLYNTVRDLRAARDAEELTATRLSALVEVAVLTARAGSDAELEEAVLGRGLAALGAQGGMIAVRDEELRGLRVVGSAGLAPAALERYALVPIDGPLPFAAVARTGERLLSSDRDPVADDASTADLVEATGLPAWAVLPLRAQGGVLGTLSVGWATRHGDSPGEVEVLEALAASCASGLERLQTRQAEQEATAGAQRVSEALQRSLLSSPPQPDDLHIVVRYRPASAASQVGGDWYDALLGESGTLSLVIGDVTGHNLEAVAEMGQLRSMLRGIAYAIEQPPAAVLTTLDRALRRLHGTGSLATALLAQVHRDADDAAAGVRRFRWSNAGHVPPLLVRADGRVSLLDSEPDLLLGLDADTPRADHEVTLGPGDTVLLYTDGLVERRGAALDDGLAWLVAAAGPLAGPDLEAACDGLLASVSAGVEDDIALLAVRARPQEHAGDR